MRCEAEGLRQGAGFGVKTERGKRMGVKRLKIKDDLRYRPKSSDRGGCAECDSFVRDMEIKDFRTISLGNGMRASGIVHTIEHRCRRIGLKPGRQYKINPKYYCDRFDWNARHKQETADFARKIKEANS
jgi:hypothetical protein